MSETRSTRLIGPGALLPAVLLAALPACSQARRAEPGAPTVRVVAPATGELLAPARIATLPEAERRAWTRYLDRSRRLAALDRESMAAELRALGRERWTPAVEGPNKLITDRMTDEWFRSEEARRIADNILSFQTPSGGWSKRLELSRRPRQPGESYAVGSGWSFIATFDNDATTDHLRFLARAHAAHADPRHADAFLRGVRYALSAQLPNGCWPQVYPLQGGYHDAATFNDDMTQHVLQLLLEVGRGEHHFVPTGTREAAAEAVRRGVECILASQVVVDGRRTVWGAQHDPLTLAPVRARTYEHASLSGGESAGLMEFLMELEAPDARVVEAVHAAAEWFRSTAIYGFEYQPKGDLTPREGAGPLWARFYEIGTDRPIFSSRDGVVLYRLDQVEEERRRGYAWYRRDAAGALRRYERWARRHPRATAP